MTKYINGYVAISMLRYFVAKFVLFFFLFIRRPPSSRLFPYTTLFRSLDMREAMAIGGDHRDGLRFEHHQCAVQGVTRSEEHTSELQSRFEFVCRLLLEQKKYRS